MSERIAAFFERPEQVEVAIRRVGLLGVPRDLVEVLVSPAAAARYPGGARRLGRRVFAYGGAGAVIGLIVGIAVSLAVIALPGFVAPRWLALVQLLGPNAATVLGGLVGGVFGALAPQVSRAEWRLVHERPDILVVVRLPSAELSGTLADTLREVGAADVRLLTEPPG